MVIFLDDEEDTANEAEILFRKSFVMDTNSARLTYVE